MSKDYFRKLIEESRKEARETQWEGTCLDYMMIVKENPEIAQLAPGRIYNMVMHKGTKSIEESIKLPDYEDMVIYNFFNEELHSCHAQARCGGGSHPDLRHQGLPHP